MSGPTPSPDDQTHALETVPGLPPQWVAELKSRWILTAEHVISLSAIPQGRAGLEMALPPGSPGLDQILELLFNAVGPEKAALLRHSQAGGALGAILTTEQQKQFETE